MKNIVSFFYFIICVCFICQSQYNKFHIGIGVYDFDSLKYGDIIECNDKEKGCDFGYLKSIANNGFDLILPYHQLVKPNPHYVTSNPSTEFITNAKHLGLNIILDCPEIRINKNGVNSLSEYNILSAINYYNFSNVIGWNIVDEPSIDIFNDIENRKSIISNHCNKFSFVNLFPNYACSNQLSNSSVSYKDYIHIFCQNIKPEILSIDHYIVEYGDTTYYSNLQILSDEANALNIPYFSMFSPLKKYPPNALGKNISEFNYAIFSNLLYGSKGLFCWAREAFAPNTTYYLPENFWDKYVSNDTKKYLKNLFYNLRENSNTLFNLKLLKVFHYSKYTGIGDNYENDLPATSRWVNIYFNDIFKKYISAIQPCYQSTLKYVAISFLEDNAKNEYFWIMNKNINNSVNIFMQLKKKCSIYNVLEKRLYPKVENIYITLEPGEGKLFRFIPIDIESNTNICNKFYNNTDFDLFSNNIYFEKNVTFITKHLQ